MKKIISILLLILLIFSLSMPVLAQENDNVMPKDYYNPNSSYDYERYQFNDYQIDVYEDSDFLDWFTGEKFENKILKGLTVIANLWLFLVVIIGQLATYILHEAFSLQLLDKFAGTVAEFIQLFAGFGGEYGLYQAFVTIFIVGAGVFALYIFLKGRIGESLRNLMGFIMALILVVFFFSNPLIIIKSLNETTNGLANTALNISARVDPQTRSISGTDLTKVASDRVFDITVQKPYKIIEFGTVNVDDNIFNQLMITTDREAYVKTLVENKGYDNFRIENILKRIFFSWFFYVVSFIFLVLMCILALTLFKVQFDLIIEVMKSPVILMLALVPGGGGLGSVFNFARNLLGIAVKKVAIALFISIWIVLSNLIFQMVDEAGFFVVMILQVMLLLGLMLKRKTIFNTTQAVLTGKFEQVKQAMPAQFNSNYEQIKEQRSAERREKLTSIAVAGAGLATGNPYMAAKAGSLGIAAWTGKKKYDEFIVNQNKEKVTTAATNQMALKYHNEHISGGTEFTRQVDENVLKGLDPFIGTREFESAKHMASTVLESGDNVNKLYKPSINPGETQQGYKERLSGVNTTIHNTLTNLENKKIQASEVMSGQVVQPVKVDYKKVLDTEDTEQYKKFLTNNQLPRVKATMKPEIIEKEVNLLNKLNFRTTISKDTKAKIQERTTELKYTKNLQNLKTMNYNDLKNEANQVEKSDPVYYSQIITEINKKQAHQQTAATKEDSK